MRRCALAFSLLCTTLGAERSARAEPVADATPAPLPSAANLDGVYLALGPVASAVRGEDGWDGGFGGEALVVRVREQDALAAIGLGLGGIRFAQINKGRIWADAVAGTEKLFGVGLGVSLGVTAEVGELQAPRWGWQVTAWAFTGVVPYVRVGQVEQSGSFVDAGIKITLPALRWR
jgi:hypothetical protein